jgi:hypothetical protein
MRKLIALVLEQLRFKKAMNILAKQQWSTDYLVYLLRKSQIQGLVIKVTEPGGRILTFTNETPVKEDYAEKEIELRQDEWDALLGIREL